MMEFLKRSAEDLSFVLSGSATVSCSYKTVKTVLDVDSVYEVNEV